MPLLMKSFYEESDILEMKKIVENGITETTEELDEMVEDELMALESIYGETMVEHINPMSDTAVNNNNNNNKGTNIVKNNAKLICLNFQAPWLYDLKDLCLKVDLVDNMVWQWTMIVVIIITIRKILIIWKDGINANYT